MNRRVERFVARGIAAALVVSVAACGHSTNQGPSAVAPTGTKQAAPPAVPQAAPQNVPQAVPQAVPPAALPAGPQAVPLSREQQQIAAMRQLVDRDPGNAKGWVALGNQYFDSQQREKAVEAYGKALQLEPDNPDVLTDQGVMYRELGAFDKAIANFEKATTIDPGHLTSLLDLGVLYAEDLKDHEKAITVWNRLIQIAPASPQAAKAHDYIQQLKQIPGTK
jgi:cytochrome c-type biogenesis protein CcmH/NrfG